MANFTKLTADVNNISALSDLPNDSDGLSAADLKGMFDKAGNDIKGYINNTLTTELETQTAASKLGATVGGSAGTVQDFINAVEAAGSGTTPGAGIVTNGMMATDVKIGSLAALTTSVKTSITNAINELVTAIGDLTTLKTTSKTSVISAVNELVTAGEIKYFAMSTPPVGYLKANGAAVSRTTYANLFAAISTTYGVGDGSTTFNLPDYRGVFIRGYDDGRGIDTGRTFGSLQQDDNKTHTHTGTTNTSGAHSHTSSFYTLQGSSNPLLYGVNGNGTATNVPTTTAGDHTHTFTTDSTGTESRPKNVSALACIKY